MKLLFFPLDLTKNLNITMASNKIKKLEKVQKIKNFTVLLSVLAFSLLKLSQILNIPVSRLIFSIINFRSFSQVFDGYSATSFIGNLSNLAWLSTTATFTNIQPVKSIQLKVVNQREPDILFRPGFENYEFYNKPGDIGSLELGDRLVYNNDYVLAYLHGGPWHKRSVDLGRKLAAVFDRAQWLFWHFGSRQEILENFLDSLDNNDDSEKFSTFILKNKIKFVSVNCDYEPGECTKVGLRPKKLPALYLYVNFRVPGQAYVYDGDYSINDIAKYVYSIIDPTDSTKKFSSIENYDFYSKITQTFELTFHSPNLKLSSQQFDTVLYISNILHPIKEKLKIRILTGKLQTKKSQPLVEFAVNNPDFMSANDNANNRFQGSYFLPEKFPYLVNNDSIHAANKKSIITWILKFIPKYIKEDTSNILNYQFSTSAKIEKKFDRLFANLTSKYSISKPMGYKIQSPRFDIRLREVELKDVQMQTVVRARIGLFAATSTTETNFHSHFQSSIEFSNDTCYYQDSYGQIDQYQKNCQKPKSLQSNDDDQITEKSIKITTPSEEEVHYSKIDYLGERKHRYGTIKTNDTTVNLKIITNLEEILWPNWAPSSKKLERNLAIIWVHKKGNGISSTVYSQAMMKLALSISDKMTDDSCKLLFQPVKYIFSKSEIEKLKLEQKFTYSDEYGIDSATESVERDGTSLMISDKIPAIIFYEKVSGRSFQMSTEFFPTTDQIIIEIMRFLKVNRFEDLERCWAYLIL